jgi:hypothetical protein
MSETLSSVVNHPLFLRVLRSEIVIFNTQQKCL